MLPWGGRGKKIGKTGGGDLDPMHGKVGVILRDNMTDSMEREDGIIDDDDMA